MSSTYAYLPGCGVITLFRYRDRTRDRRGARIPMERISVTLDLPIAEPMLNSRGSASLVSRAWPEKSVCAGFPGTPCFPFPSSWKNWTRTLIDFGPFDTSLGECRFPPPLGADCAVGARECAPCCSLARMRGMMLLLGCVGDQYRPRPYLEDRA